MSIRLLHMKRLSFPVGAHRRAPAAPQQCFASSNRSSDTRAHIDAPLRLTRRHLLGVAAGLVAAKTSGLTTSAKAQTPFPGNGDPPLLVDPAWLESQTEPNIRVLD